jgi:hypothetical protein
MIDGELMCLCFLFISLTFFAVFTLFTHTKQNSLNEPRKQSLLKSDEMTEFFDTKSFLRSIEELREFYGIQRILSYPHQLAKL